MSELFSIILFFIGWYSVLYGIGVFLIWLIKMEHVDMRSETDRKIAIAFIIFYLIGFSVLPFLPVGIL